MDSLFTYSKTPIGSEGPDFVFEQQAMKDHGPYVAGVDEVGRGPLAGPVVAAAVILNPDDIPEGLNDSKKLTALRREKLYEEIMARAAFVAIAEASVAEIDQINILQAAMLAMRRAVEKLPKKPDAVLVDGNRDPGFDLPTKTLIKGDARSFSIAAASIIAKNFRDKKMAELAKKYPHYKWEQNAGYGVPAHMEGLYLVGVSPFHRKTFAPIRKILDQENTTKY